MSGPIDISKRPADWAALGPHNIEVEQALLGALLVNSDAYSLVSHHLRPEHFFEPLHGRIYETIERLASQSQPANPITIRHHFADDPALKEVGGTAYLASLAANASTVVAAPDYARIIHELAQRRDVLLVAAEITERATRTDAGAPDDIVAEAITLLSESGPVSRAQARFTLSDVARATVDRVAEAHRTKTAPEEMMPTGSADLDRKLGGWRRKRLYIIGGRPGMGKSALVTSLLPRTAARGHGVALFSLEMDAVEVTQRMLSDLCRTGTHQIPYANIARGDLQEWEIARLYEAQERLQGLPIIIDERPGLTIAQIASGARNAAKSFERQGRRLGVICVDHMGLIRASSRYAGNKVAETEETS